MAYIDRLFHMTFYFKYPRRRRMKRSKIKKKKFTPFCISFETIYILNCYANFWKCITRFNCTNVHSLYQPRYWHYIPAISVNVFGLTPSNIAINFTNAQPFLSCRPLYRYQLVLSKYLHIEGNVINAILRDSRSVSNKVWL